MRLLAITDLHARLLPYDHDSDSPRPGSGLACLAGTIARARREVSASLLFDNGDTYQGDALGEILARDMMRAEAQGLLAHPVAAALGALGLDAAVPGNHDFDFGLDTLRAIARSAPFPFVLTNLVAARGEGPLADRPLLPPAVMLDRSLTLETGEVRPIRIGVLGLVPPGTPARDPADPVARAEGRDLLATVEAWAPYLRGAGADLVVSLCHSGLGPMHPRPGLEDAALLVAGHPQVDAVIAGHRHERHARPAAGGRAPLVAPAAHGRELGVIDLRLAPRPGGGWRLAESAVDLRPADAAPGFEARPVARIAAPAHARARALLSEVIGESAVALQTYLARVRPLAATSLIAEAQAAYARTEIGGGGLPLLSAAAPFKAGGAEGGEGFTHVPAGPIALRHVHDLYPYANRVSLRCLSGAEVRDWLERAAVVFRPLGPGARDAPLLEPGSAGYDFDLIHGLRFSIDLAAPAGERIRGLALPCGTPIAPGARLHLVTNSFRAGAEDGFPSGAPVLEGGPLVRDILADFIRQRGRLGPKLAAPGGWSFAPLPGASAVFPVPEAARPFVEAEGLEWVGGSDGGLGRLRL
nr:5'-nucleotidase C-terminal domain-containing protein [Roseivivax sp. GX 12232]